MKEDKVQSRTELNYCSFVKTILMLLVVLYHSMVFWTGNWFTCNPVDSSRELSVIAEWLNTFHIYAFALCSGYIFYYVKFERGGYSKFVPFVKTKVKRLLVPYLFVSVVWNIPFQKVMLGWDWSDIIWKYLLGTNPNQLWFLLMLFNVSIIAYVFSGLWKRKPILCLAAGCFIYVVGVLGSHYFLNVFQIWTTLQYTLFFLLGFVLRLKGTALIKKSSVLLFLLDIGLFAILIYLKSYDATVIKFARLGIEAVLHVIGAVMIFAILLRIAERLKWSECKWFNFLSTKTMTIYLFHQQIIYVLISIFNGVVNPWLNMLINFVGSMIIATLISICLTRFKATRFLIGEK